MKLLQPKGHLSQPFAANANPSYKGAGLKGHTGIDYVQGFKKPIQAVVTGEVYSILNQFNPDTRKYRAVFQLVDDIDFSYEISYGHIDTALCKEGQEVKVGEPIATEGNWGTCYSGGKLVTPEEKPSGKGSHIHFQVRKLVRVQKRKPSRQYIRNSEGYVKRDGFYYEVVDYSNGYNGCIDPALFYDEPFQEFKNFTFEEDLKKGDLNYQVELLQKALKILGFFKFPTCNGYFGEITEQAVKDFQKAHEKSVLFTLGLKKPTGYFGKSSRKKMNEIIS